MELLNNKGLMISVSGPSGVGKGTVLARVREIFPDCGQSISVTTRAPRGAECDGVEYYFRSREQFEEMIGSGEILEYDTYVGNYYGTPATPLMKMSDAGTDVLLDLTIAGSMALKDKFEQAVTIFLLPPSMETLKTRLIGRGTETIEVVEKRIEQATAEIVKANSFDYVVINDDLDKAVLDVVSIIRAEKCRYMRHKDIEKRILGS